MKDTPPCYGATPTEWAHFDVLLGLTQDLLPVVANPHAGISQGSRMKDMGKTPSIYNKQRAVVGMHAWSQRKATDEDMKRWQSQSDYGICLQTKVVRALDIDIPDAAKCQEICDVIWQFFIDNLGIYPPQRYRENSSKTLFMFIVRGEMPKRIIRVREKIVDNDTGKTIEPAWLIEFLGNGQQCVIAGTHSSGARILHRHSGDVEGLPLMFPELTIPQFNSLWAILETKFACAPSHIGGLRKRGEYVETDDAVAKMICERGLDLGMGNDGQLFIDCPWKDNHSSDNGDTETAYFPRGTGGYELGHFVCLHSGCRSKYDDTDFEEALGLRDDMFQVVTGAGGEEIPELPAWQRQKNGDVIANLYNLRLALERSDITNHQFKRDTFLNDDQIKTADGKWRTVTDGDIVNFREYLERQLKFKPIGRELMRDAIIAHGERHTFDSAKEWLETVAPVWDGVDRMSPYMVDCFGAEDTPYARAVGRYWWTAKAGRILSPGIKADMMINLQGDQGIRKSTAVKEMAPKEDWFVEINMDDDEDKLARLMQGKTDGEAGEMRGFNTKDFDGIKAWIARCYDKWVPKYRERSISAPRRLVFAGTTNHTEFLTDETGNRRFLPINVTSIDIPKIRQQKLQLFAQARDTFYANGIEWREAEELARDEHDKFTVHDAWADDISTWLDIEDINKVKPRDKEYLRTSDVLREALNIDARNSNQGMEKRCAKVLKSLGYARKKMRVDGRPVQVFVKV